MRKHAIKNPAVIAAIIDHAKKVSKSTTILKYLVRSTLVLSGVMNGEKRTT